MKRKALFVGINTYDDVEIANLSCSIADAAALSAQFEMMGFVTRLLSDPMTTCDHVMNAFDELVANLGAGDLFLFYFAGHGFTQVGGGGQLLVGRDDKYHLLSHGWKGGIPYDYLQSEIERRGCYAVFVLDACRSDILADTRGADCPTRDLVPLSHLVGKQENGGSTVVVRSCRAFLRSHEVREIGHGLFTHALLAVMKDRIRSCKNVTFNERLIKSVTDKMDEVASKYGITDRQTPEITWSGRNVPSLWTSGTPSPGYGNGDGEEQGEPEEIGRYRRAAEQGDADAQYALGNCYAEGRGVPQSWENAVKWYRVAAEQGNVNARHDLGVCYAGGRGVPQSWDEAVKWYRLAAEQGQPCAQNNLGYCYMEGLGVSQDLERAAKLYRLAAEQGLARAQYHYGLCCAEGHGEPQNWTEAAKWYRCAAEQGNVDAQCKLAVCLAKGRGVKQDMIEAAVWYRRAAEQGNVAAQYVAGLCYSKGAGVPKDLAEAAKWFRRAADRSHAIAQYNLGVCYASGQGVARNMTEAVRWLRLAASQGFAQAQQTLRLLQEGSM